MHDFWTYMKPMWHDWPFALGRLAVLAVLVLVFWKILNALTKFDDEKELVERKNWAFAVQRTALVAAFVIGSIPALTRDRGGHNWQGYLWQGAETLYVLVFLLIARVVVDYVVLTKVNNTEAIRDGNLALGITEAGFYAGLGFIINGSLDGASQTWQDGLLSTLVFGVLGLLVMIGVYGLHEAITPGDLRGSIREGKVTAALEVAGILAALGVVVRVAVAGDFTGWKDGIIAFLATAIVTIVLLYVVRFLIDRALLLTTTVRAIQAKDQVAVQAFMSGALVATAFAVAATVTTQL